ncbi:unnamed protein product [Bursaphelenchus xylophilus]|uniref:glucuronosyltransferase n=1 Tax=Bursaphelenchus xylophilus TaxID=6326 RepID=A0A1I7RW04_BURXY|nr:unnamed protein product [Bursaphelenchus xylophilus]CAG9094958.1 unnamed protein product [Bursaphelenchus xylophilus]
MRVLLHTLVAILLVLPEVWSKKVLVYQIAFGKSHIQFSGTLIDKLVEAGHTVDQLLFRYNVDVTGTGTKTHRKLYEITNSNSTYHLMDHLAQPFKTTHKISWHIMAPNRLLFCETLLKNTQLIEELKSEKYDIMLTQPWDGCNLPLAHVLGIKSTAVYVATFSSFYIFEDLGLPTPTAYLGDPFYPAPNHRDLTFYERLSNFWAWAELFLKPDTRDLEDPLFQKYFPGTPAFSTLYKRISYLFINTNEYTDMGRPVSNKVKFIGGIHIEDSIGEVEGALPQEYEDILSSKGTIIFSFGSLVQMQNVPQKVQNAFFEAFKELTDYNFIWKYDNISATANMRAPNVFFKTWLPQKQLLKDPRIRGFISHMGMNSFAELAYAGVPVVMVPLFADQRFNSAVAQRKGLGVRLEKDELTKEAILEALRQLLENPKYAENSRRLSEILAAATSKQKMAKRFVDAVELAAEFPETADLLALPSAGFSLLVANSFDVVIFLTSVAVLGSLSAIFVVYKVVKMVITGKKVKTKVS